MVSIIHVPNCMRPNAFGVTNSRYYNTSVNITCPFIMIHYLSGINSFVVVDLLWMLKVFKDWLYHWFGGKLYSLSLGRYLTQLSKPHIIDGYDYLLMSESQSNLVSKSGQEQLILCYPNAQCISPFVFSFVVLRTTNIKIWYIISFHIKIFQVLIGRYCGRYVKPSGLRHTSSVHRV